MLVDPAIILPYPIKNEAEEWIEQIKLNLVECILAQDYGPGALYWTRQLGSYLELKYPLKVEDRVLFIKTYYQVVVTKGVELMLVDVFAHALRKLLKKTKELAPIPLVLPWRPLYDLIKRTLFCPSRNTPVISTTKHMDSVIRVAEDASRYFDVNAPEEILQELLPFFYSHSLTSTMSMEGLLVHFLPVKLHADYSQHHPEKLPFHWVPTLFSIWSAVANCPSWDILFLDWMSRLAEEQVGHVFFSDIQLRYIFTIGLRLMELPVGSGLTLGRSQQQSGGIRVEVNGICNVFTKRKKDQFIVLAKFIVYTVYPEGSSETSSLPLLKNMVRMIENFYHPSNHGKWSYGLMKFLQTLATEFLVRFHRESSEASTTPKQYKIDDTIKKEFIIHLRPLVLLCMFGKDHYSTVAAQTSLKCFGWLAPELIFPKLLKFAFPALETLLETHRTTSSIACLSHVALPLFSRQNYARGGKNLLTLLDLVTPGIDMNDPNKTLTSLTFFTFAIMGVPLWDISMDAVPSSRREKVKDMYRVNQDVADFGDEDDILKDENQNIISSEYEDDLCALSTANIEEWLNLFMARIFSMFENFPEQGLSITDSATVETSMVQVMSFCAEVIFCQLSPVLYEFALKRLVNYARLNVIPQASKAMGLVSAALVMANPEKAFKLFIPHCTTEIISEISHGACSEPHTSSSLFSYNRPLDNSVFWHLNIMVYITLYCGDAILNYKKEIALLINTVFGQCNSRRGIELLGKMIRNILIAITYVYPVDYRSVPKDKWNKEYMKSHHLTWQSLDDNPNPSISWHIPQPGELQWMEKLVDDFLIPILDKIQRIISGEEVLENNLESKLILMKHIIVLHGFVQGLSTVAVEKKNSQEVELDSSMLDNGEFNDSLDDVDSHVKLMRFEAGYCFDNDEAKYSKFRGIRTRIGALLHNFTLYFQRERPDDIENIKYLIKTMGIYLTNRGIDKNDYSEQKRGFDYVKNLLVISKENSKLRPRYIHVKRAFLLHQARLKYNSMNIPLLPQYNTLMDDLLDLSLGHYSEIRIEAQKILCNGFRVFPPTKYRLIPKIIDAIFEENDVADGRGRMKGALYLLNNRLVLNVCLRSWPMLSKFMVSICKAHHEDRPSIQDLIRKVFMEFLFIYSPLPITCPENTPNQPILDILKGLTLQSYDLALQRIHISQQKIQQKYETYKEIYLKLTRELISSLSNPSLHWRYAAMAGNFLETLLREEMPIEASMASLFCKLLINDLPAMRKGSISAVIRMLYMIKKQSQQSWKPNYKQVVYPEKEGLTLENSDEFKLKWIERWNSQPLKGSIHFVDKMYIGWFVWPESYDSYLPGSSVHPVPSDQNKPAFDRLKEMFQSNLFWTKFLDFMSQESHRQNEGFSSSMAVLYKSIFQTYEDEFLDVVIPSLKRLCSNTDEKSHHKAAAELLCGIIRGSKNWGEERLAKMWKVVVPILTQALEVANPDTLEFWENFLKFTCKNRDPRRLRPLINVVIDNKFNPENQSSFTEAKKLLFVHTLFSIFGWHLMPLHGVYLELITGHMNHPYKQVREMMGGVLNEVFQQRWKLGYPTVNNVLERLKDWSTISFPPHEPLPSEAKVVETITQNLQKWKHEQDQMKAGPIIGTPYRDGAKTVLAWLLYAVNYYRVQGFYPFTLSLLPYIFDMQEDDDQDLVMQSTRLLSSLSHHSFQKPLVTPLLEKLLSICQTTKSWHVRVKVLPVLQVFYFKHLFFLTEVQRQGVLDEMAKLLLDPQLEVKQLAGITLSGIIRCSHQNNVELLQIRFKEYLKEKMPKRQRRSSTGEKLPLSEESSRILQQRHAGVLGLSSLIQAFPYEVHPWTPDILLVLAGCISDPEPIQTTVKKTFSDFRRTHQDTWHQDMKVFTEDQLLVLTDILVSPCYYA